MHSSSRSRLQAGKQRSENPRHRWKWVWWGGLGGLVLAAALGANLTRPIVQIGIPSLLIVAFVHWRYRRFVRRSEPGKSTPIWLRIAGKMWRPQGSGFYALIAAITFLGLQGELVLDRGRELWGTWRAAPYTDGGAFVDFLSSQLWSGFLEVLVAVSLETVLNVVWSGLWPLSWLQRYGVVVTVGAILLAYAMYRGARYRFPRFDMTMRHVDVSKDANHSPEELQVESGEGTLLTQVKDRNGSSVSKAASTVWGKGKK